MVHDKAYNKPFRYIIPSTHGIRVERKYMKLKLYRSTVNVVYIPTGANAPISEFKHHVFTERPTKKMMSDKASAELEQMGIDNILAIVPLSSENITCEVDDSYIELATNIESEEK